MSVRFSPRRLRLALVAAGLVAVAGLGAGQSASLPSYAADSGQVYIIQGLPGKFVDVAIDGRSVAKGLRTASVAGPFDVAGGQRRITIRSGGKVLLERRVSVTAKSSSDVVVHLPVAGTGEATITAYKNDLSAVPKGKASLMVAHTAALPPADIQVNGKALFTNIANGQSLWLVVPVATYKVAIVPTGKSSPFYFGPVSLTVKGGALNRVYAIGDPRKKTMNVALHVIAVAHSGSTRPAEVNTGTGGQAVGEQPPVYVNLLR